MEPAFQSAASLAADLRARRIGCRELLDHFLARVERFNPDLNAIVAFDFERARERAGAADAALARGEAWGPLHGLPMTVKDSYDVAGLPTTWGAPELRGNVPQTNAVAVDRLLAAGAVVFGKTNVPYNLADFQSYNDVYGTTNNPWDLERVPGGSSGGAAAALAAGLTGLEAGSDIGGSIRNPAHYCGVYGHKPTWGVLPLRGHAKPGVLAPTDISVIGPLARDAGDLALALDVMAGPDRIEAHGWRIDLPRPQGRGPGDWRVAVWADDPFCPVDHAVRAAVLRAAEALRAAGAEVDHEARPGFDPAEAEEVYTGLLQGALSARHGDEEFRKTLDRAERLGGEDSPRARRLRAGTMRHRDWLLLHERRTRLRWAWREFFDGFDVLLCPIACIPAFPHDQQRDMDARRITVNGEARGYWEQLFWAGLTGVALLPATVAPAAPEGLPIGVQIVGPEGGDYTTIEVARQLGGLIGGFRPPPGYG